MTIPESSSGSHVHIELLPARHGDSVLVEWGDESRQHTMLVDAGPATAYDDIASRLRARNNDDIDLLVMTHVDADHIEGTILLVNDQDLDLRFGDIWFNGARQLPTTLGPAQGEILDALINERGLPLNHRFAGKAVQAPLLGALTPVEFPGGLIVTILAPDGQALRRLGGAWHQALKEVGLTSGSAQQALKRLRSRRQLIPKKSFLGPGAGQDTSIANASSIVLLLEWGDVRLLLTGDSTPSVLLPAVRRLLRERGIDRLPLTALKIPHHGSRNNMTAEIAELLPAEHYLISTDGSHFRHPDKSALTTLVQHGNPMSEIHFNYDNAATRKWTDQDDGGLHRKTYPALGAVGAVLEVKVGEHA